MHPVLFEIGALKIGSYGVFLALAFLAADIVFRKEIRRRGESLVLANQVFLGALVGGLVGGKLLFILDHWGQFLADPVGIVFDTRGLSAYGGFVLAIGLCGWVIHRRGASVSTVFDAAAPGLALAYGIARIGCQLAGDGCYGTSTALPWGMSYPEGIVPTHESVHPTPIYESLYSLALFALLWRLRLPLQSTPFALFFLWLFLAGGGRFLVEFIRLNEPVALGLTASQWLALAGMGMAIIWVSGHSIGSSPQRRP